MSSAYPPITQTAFAELLLSATPEELLEKVFTVGGLHQAVPAFIFAKGVEAFTNAWLEYMLRDGNPYARYQRTGLAPICGYLYLPSRFHTSIMHARAMTAYNITNALRSATSRFVTGERNAPLYQKAFRISRYGTDYGPPSLIYYIDRTCVSRSGEVDRGDLLRDSTAVRVSAEWYSESFGAAVAEQKTAMTVRYPFLEQWLAPITV